MSMPAYTGQDLYGLIQAMIKEELTHLNITELGEVTEVFSHEADSDKNNYQVSVRLRDSGLELPRVGIATQRIGAVAIPNVGDLVLVQFIGGDIHRPIITGRVYNDQDRPPVAKPNEWVFECQDSEENDKRRLAVVFPKNNSITVTDGGATIVMGDASITIGNDGNVTITGGKDITLEAEGNVTIKSKGDISMQSDGNMKIKASQNLEAEGGIDAQLKAGVGAAVEGSAQATLKGAMVKVAGMTNFSAS